MGKKSFDKKDAEKTKQKDKILNEDENIENEDMIKDSEGENPTAKAENDGENSEDVKDSNDGVSKAEYDNLNNKLLRLQADFLNYKNRTEKEKISSYGNAVSDVIKDILPVVDNLERALGTESSADSNFKDGIVMVYEQLMGILDKKGLKEIEAIHKQFDHNVHYGVAFDAESEEEDGTIIEVFQKGYTVNDKAIRPSMVKIAKK